MERLYSKFQNDTCGYMVLQNTTAVIFPNAVFFQSVKEAMERGKRVKINVKGQSMQPFLHEGDQVVIQQVLGDAVRIGQIILAKCNSAYVLHRVVAIWAGKIYMAGDGNLVQVEKIAKSDVLALGVQGYRNGTPLAVATLRMRLLGLLWFCLRPIRRISHKLYNLFLSR